jgi:predicted enzyme related to lactoylglutathione lyase
VKDLEAAMGRVSAAGGKVLLPKMSIGEYGVIAHFQDSEGNRVALHADENS